MTGATGASPLLARLAVVLLVIVFVLWRQRQARRFRGRLLLPVALALVGVVALSTYAQAHPLSAGQAAWLALLLLLDAVGLGAVRAYTVRLWLDEEGQAWSQGTWWTIGLWLVGIVAHVLADGADGAGSASALLYLGLTLTAQRLVLAARVRGGASRDGLGDTP